MTFSFQLIKTHGQPRAGTIMTSHGTIETPVFMPVGTQSTVKALTFEQVDNCGAEIVLANTYHLHLRPGEDLIAKAGGLHKWTSYDKPFLTDSGGFQIFSQSHINKCKITDEGAFFTDNITGDKHFIGPKEAIEIQHKLGADIIMAFDHCPPGQASYEEVKDAMERTHNWAKICIQTHRELNKQNPYSNQSLFLIVQGGVYKELRKRSVDELTRIADEENFNVPGFAIGGVSVGESREDVDEIVKFTAPLLPRDKPRYLMGIGTTEDIFKAVTAGIDMFDCVMPTRIARHGSFFDLDGKRKLIKSIQYKEDFNPLIDGCDCYTCINHSRSYIRHLWRAGETVAGTLLSIHNLRYLINLTKKIRGHIINGTFEDGRKRN